MNLDDTSDIKKILKKLVNIFIEVRKKSLFTYKERSQNWKL